MSQQRHQCQVCCISSLKVKLAQSVPIVRALECGVAVHTVHTTLHMSRVTCHVSQLATVRCSTACQLVPVPGVIQQSVSCPSLCILLLLLADPRTRRRFYCLFSRYYHLIVRPGEHPLAQLQPCSNPAPDPCGCRDKT